MLGILHLFPSDYKFRDFECNSTKPDDIIDRDQGSHLLKVFQD